MRTLTLPAALGFQEATCQGGQSVHMRPDASPHGTGQCSRQMKVSFSTISHPVCLPKAELLWWCITALRLDHHLGSTFVGEALAAATWAVITAQKKPVFPSGLA